VGIFLLKRSYTTGGAFFIALSEHQLKFITTHSNHTCEICDKLSTKPKVLTVATMDTKFKEALFVKKCLEAQYVTAIVAVETAKNQFPGRAYHIHNSAITAVRTSRQELIELARTLAGFCKNASGPVAFLIPLGRFSAFDSPGGPLEDKEPRYTFRDALRESLPADITIVESEHHINEPEFADKIPDITQGVYNALPNNKR